MSHEPTLPPSLRLTFRPSVRLSTSLARFHPQIRTSLVACLAWSCVVLSLFALTCHTKRAAYLFGALFGVQIGWIIPLQRFAFSSIIPGGQEAELFGILCFASQVGI